MGNLILKKQKYSLATSPLLLCMYVTLRGHIATTLQLHSNGNSLNYHKSKLSVNLDVPLLSDDLDSVLFSVP